MQQLAHRQTAPVIRRHDDLADAEPVAHFHQTVRFGFGETLVPQLNVPGRQVEI
jgi:hypothetical protein